MFQSKNRSPFVAAALLATFAFTAVPAVQAQTAPPVHHKNFIQKHPNATGFAAGLATHHALKVAAARDKRNHKKLNFAERHPTLSGIGVGVVTSHEIKKHTAK